MKRIRLYLLAALVSACTGRRLLPPGTPPPEYEPPVVPAWSSEKTEASVPAARSDERDAGMSADGAPELDLSPGSRPEVR